MFMPNKIKKGQDFKLNHDFRKPTTPDHFASGATLNTTNAHLKDLLQRIMPKTPGQ